MRVTRLRRYLYFVSVLVAVLAVALWLSRRNRDADRAGERSARAPRAEASAGSAAEPEIADDSFGRQYRFSTTAPTNQVTGTVLDATDRRPVPDVDVTFRRGKPETTATSGADGAYSVELAPGTYDVRAVGAGVLALPQPQLKIGRLGEAVHFDVYVARLATVSGTVAYQDGRRASGAEVEVRESSEGARLYVRTGELAGASTGPDGRFEVRALPGALELRATDGELVGFTRVEGIIAGAARSGVEIVLDERATVWGTVRDVRGRPVAGASVTISVQRPRTWQYERTTVEADGGGRFEAEVRPGRTVLVAVADGFAPAKEQTVELAPAARKEVDLALQDPLVLAGHVVDAEGRHVADAVVSHLRYASKLPTVRQTTGSDGSFRFTDVGRDPQVLVAELEDYGKGRIEGAVAPADDLELTLVPYGGIRGTVTGEDEEPVGQFVAIIERDGKPVGVAPSRFMADDGRFELFPVEPGRYDVVVFGPGYAPTRAHDVKVPARGWGDGSVTLHAGGSIVGTVRAAPQGAPVAGARVSATSGHRGGAATTSADGRFTLRNVASGKRVLVVQHPKHPTLRSQEIEVRAGEETSVDLTLAPASGR